MKEKYFKILYDLSTKAARKGEVPVSALIVNNDKVIARAHNSRINDSNPLNHAEIKCIIKAAKVLGDWRLNDCDLYITLEPCHMCTEIIKECRIRKVYYLSSSKKTINYKTIFHKFDGELSTKYSDLLTNFFRELR